MKAVIREIDKGECLELLRSEQVGRIGVVIDGLPEIFPVSYTLDASDSVVFRTAIGSKLPAAVNHQVVFEVDQFDRNWRTGWSVIVHGVAQQTQSIKEGEHVLVSWRDDAPYLVRISQQSLTGRRIERHPETDNG